MQILPTKQYLLKILYFRNEISKENFVHFNFWYSLKPSYGVWAQHPMVNDDLPNRVISGSIKIKDDIKRFTQQGAEFVDGTKEDDIDVVILATGYSFGFPFVEKEVKDC